MLGGAFGEQLLFEQQPRNRQRKNSLNRLPSSRRGVFWIPIFFLLSWLNSEWRGFGNGDASAHATKGRFVSLFWVIATGGMRLCVGFYYLL